MTTLAGSAVLLGRGLDPPARSDWRVKICGKPQFHQTMSGVNRGCRIILSDCNSGSRDMPSCSWTMAPSMARARARALPARPGPLGRRDSKADVMSTNISFQKRLNRQESKRS